ncbi:MAG: BLUF domain-containing protein [Oceanicaulis sp.]
MFLTRLIYVSRPTFEIRPPVLDGELRRIAEAGLRRNPLEAVTGLLAIDSDWFVQVLEGSRPTVNRTVMRIANDRRHTGFEIVLAEEADRRVFPDWAVAFSDQSTLPLSEPRHVDFSAMPGDALLQRMLRIRRTGVIACSSIEAA